MESSAAGGLLETGRCGVSGWTNILKQRSRRFRCRSYKRIFVRQFLLHEAIFLTVSLSFPTTARLNISQSPIALELDVPSWM